ncbi:MAG TPA: CbtB-domain containing protein [Alphaproteobacteria bacterium]|nr:CbtB-domain containing protein [Alphaproteobacteria bacterium]
MQADRSKIAALATLSLGALFIFIIGFSHIDVLHNAAHDTRHAVGFPCH